MLQALVRFIFLLPWTLYGMIMYQCRQLGHVNVNLCIAMGMSTSLWYLNGPCVTHKIILLSWFLISTAHCNQSHGDSIGTVDSYIRSYQKLCESLIFFYLLSVIGCCGMCTVEAISRSTVRAVIVLPYEVPLARWLCGRAWPDAWSPIVCYVTHIFKKVWIPTYHSFWFHMTCGQLACAISAKIVKANPEKKWFNSFQQCWQACYQVQVLSQQAHSPDWCRKGHLIWSWLVSSG